MISLTYFDFLCNLTILLILFFTALSYATGLFYLAELAEEFPTVTKRIIRYIILSLSALHILAFLSALPKLPLAIGLLTHLSYLPLLRTFPVLPLSSPLLYVSLLLVVASQVGWYWSMPSSPYASYVQTYPYNSVRSYSSAQLLAFYLLFVWLVPLVLFVAGSVSGHSLPSMGDRMRGGEDEERKGKGGKWSIASIGRWCKREKGGGSGGIGREKKEDGATATDSYNSRRYEPNPAFYANPGAAPAAVYTPYRPTHPQGSGNDSGAAAWYGQQQQASAYGGSSNEGEWMGQQHQQLHAPHTAMRQRSHIS